MQKIGIVVSEHRLTDQVHQTPVTPIQIRRIPNHADIAVARNPVELLAALYANRGLTDAGEAAPGLGALESMGALHGLDRAVALLADQLRAGGHLLIVGDYDADGATGSALAVRGLRALGAARVSYLVPSRFAFGYGLSPAVVEAALTQRPDLIVTVDNGIASIAGVTRARELGIPVLVTDHHLPGDQLPDAAAIVNPNQPDCAFPSKHLAGVGVVFYLLAALRAHLRETGWFEAGRVAPNLAELLDLVALGTVADVVILDRNNRILVEQGLRRIRAGRCCPGILALLQVAGRDPSRATTTDLGFFAAPRLNAAGRLEEMSLGVECLLTDDTARAVAMAQELDGLNRRRREIEGEMKDQAELLLDALCLDGETLPLALCLFGEDWHQGVSGIVAARIRERYHRPVIAFAEAGDGLLRGSARSIDGLHIRDAIDRVDRHHPGLIERFGGHAMAAGLTLRAEGLEDFRDAFIEAVRAQLGDLPRQPEIRSDGPLPGGLMTLDTAEALRLGGPWGKGFPEPCFDGGFEVLQARIVGERHLKLRVAMPDGEPIDAIGFNLGEKLPEARGRVRLAYRLDVNDYRGVRSPQLILEDLQADL
ncbi:single-stranded-DNA-specific exonuclease RecJ [Thiocystis violascens DSM 198]|uniref:Single-stranded-DNA-specific exonuclease RecJ n=1 Tax=Thiocystis violascens (strain ATCC 17096 / DSM 198 / 6111) TaxID=765911 RepID=I3Y742_THIV6|nr:single-stranded-DNA-specific exonuclease RecJ [Thiocystis violascens DSM 198]